MSDENLEQPFLDVVGAISHLSKESQRRVLCAAWIIQSLNKEDADDNARPTPPTGDGE